MNLTRVIDALSRSSLSKTLARNAVSLSAPQRSRRAAQQLDWVNQIAEITREACVRFDGRSVVTVPTDPYTLEFVEFVMLRAMIAAAVSDDRFDDERRMTVLQRVCSLDLTTEEKMFLMQEIQRPLSIRRLARYGRTTETAAALYAASLLPADLSNPSAMLYLTALADALELSPALVAQIHHCSDRISDPAPGRRLPHSRSRSATLQRR